MKERNSYSKTDPDATFMRLKDDHMNNGQLKPAYNLQISTNNQMILNYSVEQKSTDTTTLINHLESFQSTTGIYPTTLIADAGYGSEENYEYLEDKGVDAYVKYNYFHKEQKRKHKENAFLPSNLHYNTDGDYLVCPMGQRMDRVGHRTRRTTTGYEQLSSVYEAKRCSGCPLRSSCHKSMGNRRVELNYNLLRYKSKARELLQSDKGVYHRGKRCCDVEATFGILKQNKGFKRYSLRGLEKVSAETGIVAIAHNLKKLSKKLKE